MRWRKPWTGSSLSSDSRLSWFTTPLVSKKLTQSVFSLTSLTFSPTHLLTHLMPCIVTHLRVILLTFSIFRSIRLSASLFVCCMICLFPYLSLYFAAVHRLSLFFWGLIHIYLFREAVPLIVNYYHILPFILNLYLPIYSILLQETSSRPLNDYLPTLFRPSSILCSRN